MDTKLHRVIRLSDLYDENSYIGKMTSLFGIKTQYDTANFSLCR